MFYLLENNPTGIRILDDKNNEIEHKQITDMKDEMEISFLSSIKIIKFSESVFDLIEAGDLVMVDKAKIYSNFYTEPIIETSQVFWSDSHHSLCVYPRRNGYYCPIISFGVQKGILAIYKPNSNGDYIKVWEKKDD